MNYEVTMTGYSVYTTSDGAEHRCEHTQVYTFGNGEDALAFMETATKHIRNFESATLEIVLPDEEVF